MKKYALAFVIAAGILAADGALYAHSGATGVVKQRMVLMKDIAAEMKTIGAMARGKVAFDSARLAAAADRVAGHGKHMPMLFPKESLQAPTEATVRIWQDWDGFVASATTMQKVATSLAAAGRAGDRAAVKSGFRALGKTCSTCHKDYREKRR